MKNIKFNIVEVFLKTKFIARWLRLLSLLSSNMKRSDIEIIKEIKMKIKFFKKACFLCLFAI